MLKQYYRLTKPGIIYGNIMTAVAGFLLASKTNINFLLLLATVAGTALVIASACVLNNYIDRDVDQKMERTKKRALASGIIPVRNAFIFAFILGVLGFLILSYTNLLTASIGFAAFFSYVILYGFAKRYSMHGTLVGTFPGAASLVAGYTSVASRLDLAAFLLFLIMVTWQMAHFFSIAIFRLKDYKAAGLPVLPAKKGIGHTKIQILLYITLFIIASASLTFFEYTGYTYLIAMLLIGLYWLYKGLKGFSSSNDTAWARAMFGLSLVVLLVFSAITSLDMWLP